jgi:NAD(P)-dependent dehydrogenase (short-subunit alcohol dehydrogenase family)
MGRLEGRVAIVTGGGQGIGRGVARAFASEGAQVVIASRGREAGEQAAREIAADFGARAVYVQTDVSEEQGVRSLVERAANEFGRIDILVNNATPAGGGARLERMQTAAVEEHVRVNYYGAFWAMQAVFPHMKRRGWGRILSMASLNGINAHQHTAMYNGAKEALRALTRTAAVEWACHGITCNVLCPAAVTPPWQAFERFDPKAAQALVEMIPMRRMGDSEADIGPVAVFLASDESRYMTGNTLHVDGGGHINGVPWKFELPG